MMPPMFLPLVAALSLIWMAASMPDPVTEQDCRDCEQALESLSVDKADCEKAILKATFKADQSIASMKEYFAKVETQMKELEPGVSDLKKSLAIKHAEEAVAYKELRDAQNLNVQSFLQIRKKSRLPSEELLVDRWMKCDDNRKSAQVGANACKTRTKTVEMWNTQRIKMYKDKADVYIMRVAKMSDPVTTQTNEVRRVGQTVTRIKAQVQALKDNLPLAPIDAA